MTCAKETYLFTKLRTPHQKLSVLSPQLSDPGEKHVFYNPMLKLKVDR